MEKNLATETGAPNLVTLAFSQANYNLGLLKMAQKATINTLLELQTTEVTELDDALKIESFAEGYPMDELVLLRGELDLPEATASTVWSHILKKEIAPAVKKVNRFIAENHNLIKISASPETQKAWEMLAKTLCEWAKYSRP